MPAMQDRPPSHVVAHDRKKWVSPPKTGVPLVAPPQATISARAQRPRQMCLLSNVFVRMVVTPLAARSFRT
jgi:hypothetical protein